VLTSFDAYDLYLVHQPFAFPIALVAKVLFHSYGAVLGWFVFLGVVAVATKLVTAGQRAIFAAFDRRAIVAADGPSTTSSRAPAALRTPGGGSRPSRPGTRP
jgi:hypothetical protein